MTIFLNSLILYRRLACNGDNDGGGTVKEREVMVAVKRASP